MLSIKDWTFTIAIVCEKILNEKIFIHPFDDYDVINGQGTIGCEIQDDLDVDIILGAIGGGGMMSGISAYVKHISNHCELIGVESKGCASMYTSLKNNKIQIKDNIGVKKTNTAELVTDIDFKAFIKKI